MGIKKHHVGSPWPSIIATMKWNGNACRSMAKKADVIGIETVISRLGIGIAVLYSAPFKQGVLF